MFSLATRRPSAVARTVLVVVLLGVAAALPLAGQGDEPVDLDAVFAIKAEGFERSRVMELMSWLTDVHGPRLTGSPNLQAAADYTVEQFAEWGLSNIAQDVWGEFGRGWSNERFYAHAIEPQAYPLIGYSKAWTPGAGAVVAAGAGASRTDGWRSSSKRVWPRSSSRARIQGRSVAIPAASG